jgi:hypothetical protein
MPAPPKKAQPKTKVPPKTKGPPKPQAPPKQVVPPEKPAPPTGKNTSSKKDKKKATLTSGTVSVGLVVYEGLTNVGTRVFRQTCDVEYCMN